MIFVFLSIVAGGCFFNTASGNEVSPNIKAYQMAKRNIRLQGFLKSLEKEANSISNSKFRQDALSILKQPVFSFIPPNRNNEKKIIHQLISEKLLDPKFSGPLFPEGEPMSFIASSGSPWLGHHSYPGGLIYHTLTNLKMGLHYAEVYEEIYDVKLKRDEIRFAAILHDSAKTITLPWNRDGSCAKQETTIAGTSAHHIFAVAEAIYRKYPPEFIVILASAHSPPFAGQALEDLIRYLKAASILAGASYTDSGLTKDGQKLAAKPPLEAFVNHLDDHDYVLTQTTIQSADAKLGTPLLGDYWKRNELLSEKGDLRFY